MEALTARRSATVLPRSVCYRCPTSVIAAAKALVPEIEAAAGPLAEALQNALLPLDAFSAGVQGGLAPALETLSGQLPTIAEALAPLGPQLQAVADAFTSMGDSTPTVGSGLGEVGEAAEAPPRPQNKLF